MVSGVQKTCFAASASWPAGLYIVPKHFFAMDVRDEAAPIALSHEHQAIHWLRYDEANAMLRYDDDKTAMWELDARLRANALPEAIR